jgi:photosystem II stability/assembly factor-like uncharacterized protein
MLKRTLRFFSRVRRMGLVAPVLLAALLLAAGNWSSHPALLAPAPSDGLQNEDESTESANRKAREEWFRLQRAYPFDSIPAEGRLSAWKTRPQEDFRVEAAGSLWQSIGPRPISSAPLNNWGMTSGRITAVAISPANPQIVLFGGAEGGVWRSTDSGASFVPVSDNQVDLSVNSIAFALSNPAIVYAGMGSDFLGTGVLKSTDSGLTWVRINNSSLPSPGYIFKISVNRANPNIVYACQYATKVSSGFLSSSGFFFSTDGGVNWRRTLAGLANDVATDPGDPQKLLMSMLRVDERSLPPGIYRSTDGGNNWTNVYTGPFVLSNSVNVKLSNAPSTPNTFYAYAGGTINGVFEVRVLVSTDDGVSWTERAGIGMKKSVWDYIAVDPNNSNNVYIGVEDVYKSTDGGNSFVNITNNYTLNSTGAYSFTPSLSNSHADEHDLAFSPADSRVFYIGCDGGLYKTTDAGTTFQSLNAGLTLAESYSIAIHPNNPAITYSGTQDNSTMKRLDGGSQWKELITGDGGNIVINPLNPSTFFGTYVVGTVWRWVNDGARIEKTVGTNTIFGEPSDGARINFIAAFTGNGVDSTLYFGTYRLFISKDLGDTWVPPAGDFDLTKGRHPTGGFDVISVIGVARSNTNVIYTGSNEGRAMMSSNAGQTWTDISNGLPNRFIKSITVDKANPAIAYLTVSGYASGHVFKTTNFGASWQDVSGNLPDIPTNALLIDQQDSSVIYVGTDIGVFRSAAGGSNWQSFSDGMPPVVVMAFASHPSGIIQAATYGRGIYELNTNSTASDFSLGVNTGAQMISQGSSTKFIISAQSATGFSLPVMLSASVTPADPSVTVSFSSSTVNIGGSVELTVKTTDSTPQGVYSVSIVGASGNLVHRETVNVTVTVPQLSVNSAVFTPPKSMLILGTRFGTSPRLLINGVDRSDYIKNSTDSQINIKGKAKNLGVKAGDNTVQVIDAIGRPSNILTFQF